MIRSILVVGGGISGLTAAIALRRYVVESSARMSHWQVHPGTPGADPAGLGVESAHVLAQP
jgi:thioredoxin reductase